METLSNSINLLLRLEKIKVWSLIVSLFGDLEQSGSQVLSGKQLNTILGHIGIKPEATRVALHRLKNDKWIETSKSGRETLYKMSKKAVTETANVYKDVYGTSIKYHKGWCLQITQENFDKNKIPSVQIVKNVSLVPVINADTSKQILRANFARSDIPQWVSKKVINSKIQKIVTMLLNVTSNLNDMSSNASQLDQIVLRLLILHHWRKLALRDNIWCHIWLFAEGDLALCQKEVTQFLSNGLKANPLMLD